MNVSRELLERVWEVYMCIESSDTIPTQLWDKSYDEVWEALWGREGGNGVTLNVKALKPLYEAATKAHLEFRSILNQDRDGNLDHSLIHDAIYDLRAAIRLAEECE